MKSSTLAAVDTLIARYPALEACGTDIRAAITGIVSGRTADDDFYGHLLQQMSVYRDGRVEVALNLLPAKWVYVLDGLEKYRAKIGGHDASSVPMSVSRPFSSG